MLKSLKVKNFKKFDELEIKDINFINIIVGDNSVGKTTLLECINILSKSKEQSQFMFSISQRNSKQNIFYTLKNIFNKKNKSEEIEIESVYDFEIIKLKINKAEKQIIEILDEELKKLNSIKIKLETEYQNKKDVEEFEILEKEILSREIRKNRDIFSCELITPLDYLSQKYVEGVLTEIIEGGGKNKIISPLKYFEKNIIDINYSPVEKEYIVTLENDGEKYTLPITSFGDGVKKTLVLLSHIYAMRNGVLLIDEIETGLHRDVLVDVYRAVIEIIELEKTQVFITTHSLEALKGFVEAGETVLDKISLHKIEEYKQKYYVDTYKGERLKNLLFNLGGDPR